MASPAPANFLPAERDVLLSTGQTVRIRPVPLSRLVHAIGDLASLEANQGVDSVSAFQFAEDRIAAIARLGVVAPRFSFTLLPRWLDRRQRWGDLAMEDQIYVLKGILEASGLQVEGEV